MNFRSLNIFLASALGAGIGSLVALSMGVASWWIGLCVGAAVGYLSYEWKEAVAAVPRAYRAAKGWSQAPWRGEAIREWVRLSVVLGTWMVPIGGILIGVLMLGVPDYSLGRFLHFVRIGMADTVSMIPALGVATALVVLFQPEETTRHDRGLPWRYAAPCVFFRAALAVPRVIVAAVPFLARFAWELFVRVHSEERLICGVDAMFGAAIGYMAGSALVGAIAGGLLGMLNYELVTRRWLIPAGYVTAKARVR